MRTQRLGAAADRAVAPGRSSPAEPPGAPNAIARSAASLLTDGAALALAAVTLFFASGRYFIDPVLARILHIGLGFLMVYAMAAGGAGRAWRLAGWAGVMAIIPVTGYAFWYYPLSFDYVGLPPGHVELGLGGLAFVLASVAAWRVAGASIPVIVVALVGYTLAGPALPAPFTHAGLNLTQLVQALYVTDRGLYGSITGVSANYIVLFVIFAAYLSELGFIDFLLSKSGRLLRTTRGAAAKLAVVASGTLGAIMGSAYGNTATTGAFTIPLMIRTGFTPAFAAAVEATASVGGQFMPPVLGGAAFLMSDILGISYLTIMAASLPLALMFYLSIFLMVDLRAARDGLGGAVVAALPPVEPRKVFGGGWLKLVPIAVLVMLLVQGYTPQRAGFWAIASTALVDLVESRSFVAVVRHFLRGLIAGARGSAVIVGVIGAASVLSGITSTTGLGLVLSHVLTALAGDSLLVLLVLCAITSTILGLGLPTLVCYLLMAVLVAPALTKAGLPPLVAHMFLMYYASLSSITPPVGPSNFIAASIAGNGVSPMRVGLEAMRLAAPAFILPFIFAYHPDLLLVVGTVGLGTIWNLVTAVIGVYAITAAQSGIVLPRDPVPGPWLRSLLALAGASLLWPQALSDLAGLALLVAIHLHARSRHRETRATGPAQRASE